VRVSGARRLALIARNKPEYLKIRNPNTGGPAGAGPVAEMFYDKLNSVLRRLNVYGYRHYHAFDGWMRQAFLRIAEASLLSKEALSRGIVRETEMRRLVAEAGQGAAHRGAVATGELVERFPCTPDRPLRRSGNRARH
jgi:hypothetical protein